MGRPGGAARSRRGDVRRLPHEPLPRRLRARRRRRRRRRRCVACHRCLTAPRQPRRLPPGSHSSRTRRSAYPSRGRIAPSSSHAQSLGSALLHERGHPAHRRLPRPLHRRPHARRREPAARPPPAAGHAAPPHLPLLHRRHQAHRQHAGDPGHREEHRRRAPRPRGLQPGARDLGRAHREGRARRRRLRGRGEARRSGRGPARQGVPPREHQRQEPRRPRAAPSASSGADIADGPDVPAWTPNPARAGAPRAFAARGSSISRTAFSAA